MKLGPGCNNMNYSFWGELSFSSKIKQSAVSVSVHDVVNKS